MVGQKDFLAHYLNIALSTTVVYDPVISPGL